MINNGVRRLLVLAAAVALAAVVDLFSLLLLPVRVGGHLVPAGPLLVLAGNAVLATAANRLTADRLPAQLLLGLAVLLSATAVVGGPGGDVIVTRDLEGMYLVFVVAACFGAVVPLLRRPR
ncbi:MAG: hypothetical protein NVSMB55_25500 [Mycobacteriales bacterium]